MPTPIKTTLDALVPGSTGILDNDPHVVALANGKFGVGFTSSNDATPVATFTTLGGSPSFIKLILPSVLNDDFDVSGAALDDGNVLAVHVRRPDATGDADIVASFLNTATATASERFTVNAGFLAGQQSRPEALQLVDGSVVIVWIDRAVGQIRLARFEHTGLQIGLTQTVSGGSAGQDAGTVDIGLTRLANDGFVVSWFSEGGVEFPDQAQFRIYNADAGAVTAVVDATGFDFPSESHTDAAALAGGGFAYTYTVEGVGVFAQIHDDAGILQGPAFLVSSFALASFAAITGLHDGRFMVAYEQGGDVFGRMYLADGTADSAEFTINASVAGTQGKVSLDTLADGRVAVAWEDSASGGGDVRYAVYDPRLAGLDGAATGLGDTWVGTNFADSVFLGAGNDSFSGLDGTDVIRGEAGNDKLFGGLLADNIGGGLGVDNISGDGGDDVINGDDGGDILNGGADNDTINGGAGNDSITGGTENDTLNGGIGGDQLAGGFGSDILNGGDGADSLFGNDGDDAASYLGAALRIKLALDGSFAAEGEALLDSRNSIESVIGTALGDVIRGDAGANRVIGEGGSDTLQGMDGADTLFGGQGADALTGGLGDDIFDYTALSQGGDTIKDFGALAGNDDSLRFLGSAFGGLPAGALAANRFASNATGLATTADHRFIYETDAGILRFDSNGTGAGGVTVIATFTGAPTLAAADIVIL